MRAERIPKDKKLLLDVDNFVMPDLSEYLLLGPEVFPGCGSHCGQN